MSLETRHIANGDSLAGGEEEGGPSGMCVLETTDPSNTVTGPRFTLNLDDSKSLERLERLATVWLGSARPNAATRRVT